MGLITRRRKWWKTSSPPPWASWGWMKIAWSSCCSFPWRTTQPPLCTSSSASRCSGAAGWPTACWAWRAPVLPWDRQAAPQLPPGLLAPDRGLLVLVQSPPTTLLEPARTKSRAAPVLPFKGVPACPPPAWFRTRGTKKRPRRRHQRLCLDPPQQNRAGTIPKGGPGEPRRGGPPPPRPLLQQPRRGHPAGNTRAAP